jgi:hypothetical protein
MESIVDNLPAWTWADNEAVSAISGIVGHIASRERPWYEHVPRVIEIDPLPTLVRVQDNNGRGGMVAHVPPKHVYKLWYRHTDVLWMRDGWWTLYGSFEVDACDEDWIDLGGEA